MNTLNALRQLMRQYQIDAWIAPTADPHLSEYLPAHWQTREYLSGFTGSAGVLVVTATQAHLWTDSRYFEQAEKQLQNSGIVLQKIGIAPPYTQWLANELPENATVASAGEMISLANRRQLEQAFSSKNIQLDLSRDLINEIWHHRPALPNEPIYPHPAEFVSENASEKLARVRAAMQEQAADFHLISALDDIAWLTNLRGSDVPYNPIFLAFLLISQHKAILFVETSKLTPTAMQTLQQAGIETAPYHAITQAISQLSGTILLQSEKTAVSTLAHLPSETRIIEQINPSTLFKSIKSPADIAHIRHTMAQDGAALCGFFAELERKIQAGERVSELDVDTMLYQHRSARENFVSLSFNTIAGFNQNGALPHYTATPDSFSYIEGNGLLLIDSGAQYFGGTTDITRVIAIGEVSAEQKRDYTLVLKAHIALAQCVFPENIGSTLLDSICRQPLWQAHCNFGHGTGHGVGYFLNVHEGPQTISYASTSNPHQAMKVGMLTSNEPALYRPNRWGIRIENLIVNQAVEMPSETEFGKFLCFETLTLCPIDTRPIEIKLLTDSEMTWLNTYHQQVRDTLSPLLDGEAKDWLIRHTEAI